MVDNLLNTTPTILVYRNHLLAVSETFIFNQTIKLENYKAIFIGSKKFKGKNIDLPDDRKYLISNGSLAGYLQDMFFKLTGHVPDKVTKWIQSYNPVLLHAHFGPDAALALPISKRLRIPLVISLLGSDITISDQQSKRSFYSQRLFLKRRKELINYASAVIVPSEFLKKRALQLGFHENSIYLIRHGVDLTRYTIKRNNKTYGLIVYVGRLIQLKGLHFLIEAISRIQDEFPDIKLVVIGDGPQRTEYEKLAMDLLKINYEFLGSQPNERVFDFLSKAYIFSVPSVTMPSGAAEAFGLVFVEAQAMGVPVVSFTTGGIPEVVDHGQTGFLSPERDIEELAQNLRVLLLDQDLHSKMSKKAEERVETLFDLSAQNKKLEGVYRTVLMKTEGIKRN